MKVQKGTPFSEWVNNGPMTEDETTTARVSVIFGAVMGFIMGICATLLVLIALLTHTK